MNDESLFAEPQPDRFEHESPIRMFTEWNVHGSIAIGKGIRPSPQHLPVYLDAMEKKEGWQLGQMFLDDHGVPKTMWFRKVVPTIEFLPEPPRLDFSSIETFLQTLAAALGISYEQLTEDLDGPEPIPEFVYWSAEDSNFYGMTDRCDQGREFFNKWYPRRAEFPTTVHEDDLGPHERLIGEETYQSLRDLPEVRVVLTDDPVNPRHYGGTACAEIGERLTANCYQVLKYIWRLGEKDDPVIELGKALWYLHREIALGLPASRGEKLHPRGLQRMKVVELTEGRPPLVQAVALILWNMNYGMGTAAAWSEAAHGLRAELEAHKRFYESADRGRGQEP